MFELTSDYERNIHKREPESANEKFVKEFMASTPLFDPNND
jgi:hypothetical protein